MSRNTDTNSPTMVALMGKIDSPEDLVVAPYCSPYYGPDTPYQFRYILEQRGSIPCTTLAEEEWRGRFYEYNTLYYDPTKTYLPWPGLDDDGNDRYPNSDVENALFDPMDPDGNKLNLLEDSALLGEDFLGDDYLDLDREYNYHESDDWADWCDSKGIPHNSCKGWRYYYLDGSELKMRWVRDLTEDKQTSFANWFTYHRTREFVAKYAIASIVSQVEGVRVGYGNINDHSETEEIGDIGDISDPNDGNRSDLLDKIYDTTLSGNTPLRSHLRGIGEYYKTGSLFGETVGTPILNEADNGACQSNNTILMTDGYYDLYDPYDSDTLPSTLGNIDENSGTPYSDSWSNTLADIAMNYYANDLSETLDGMQRMHTYTVSLGLTGSLNPDNINTSEGSSFSSWPNPSLEGPYRVDDLFHAAVNSRASYFSSKNPAALTQALTSTIEEITSETQSTNSAASSGPRLQAGSMVFLSEFSSGNWSSKFLGYSVNDSGEISSTPAWDAAEELPSPGDRIILTTNNTTGLGIPFAWNNISETQKTALNNGHADGNTIGEARLNYLRGASPTDVGYSFRERDSLLGDIINSSPVYVGTPAMLIPDTAPYGVSDNRYSTFKNEKKDRTPMVYVGANDGMLHGFNAKPDSGLDDGGKELLAYVPETVFNNLHELPGSNYSHRYYVDQAPTVADAYFAKSGSGSEDWHTVLVGGLGAGGRGIFALDITDPSSFSDSITQASSTVLWEFNSNDDSDFGYSFSKPTVALVAGDRWAVIVGNGYNSDDGHAKLFIIYLDADPSDGWNIGSDYLKIDTQIGSIADKNGLSSPAIVDTDGDGYTDRVYAGDLHGNLWAFDISNNDTTEWGSAYEDNSNAPKPLFTAINAGSERQAITTKPEVIRHPYQATIPANKNNPTSPNLMIFFGTGQYLVTTDLDNTETQGFYGIWDKGEGQLNRSNLIQQTITSGTDSNNSIEARITSDIKVPYYDTNSSQRFGWLLDLDSATAATGERVIAGAKIINNIVFFNTYIPNAAPCDPGGDSWFMFVKAINGGIPPRPVIDINASNSINDDDMVTLPEETTSAPSGMKTAGTFGSPLFDLGTGGSTGSVINNTSDGLERRIANISPKALGKRISWGELRLE